MLAPAWSRCKGHFPANRRDHFQLSSSVATRFTASPMRPASIMP